MKKAYSFAPLAVFAFMLGRLHFEKASQGTHDRIINSNHRVIAIKSFRTREWYVIPRYRLILGRHTLERIVRKQSFWKYWFGKEA